MAKRVTLYYGGEKYPLPENQANLLRGLEPDSAGVLQLNLGEQKWLSIVYGPGIPIAVLSDETETKVRVASVR